MSPRGGLPLFRKAGVCLIAAIKTVICGHPRIRQARYRKPFGSISYCQDCWNNATRKAFWHRGAVRHCLPGKCHILDPDEPKMACLAVESVLSEDAVLTIRGARETRSSRVHEPPRINFGRAVLQLS